MRNFYICNVRTVVYRSYGLHGGKGGRDHLGIWTTEGKLCGISDTHIHTHTISSLNAKVKLLYVKILNLTVFDDDNDIL
jgi:hypothetical protein